MPLKQLQEAVDQAAGITGFETGITDLSGNIMACSVKSRNTSTEKWAAEFAYLGVTEAFVAGYLFRRIVKKSGGDLIAFFKIDGVPAESEPDISIKKMIRLFASTVSGIRSEAEEKPDKSTFFRSIITENILPGDISLRARELRLDADAVMTAYCVKIVGAEKNSAGLYDVLINLFPNKNKDHVILLDDSTAALVKELKEPRPVQASSYMSDKMQQEMEDEMTAIAGTISSMLISELMVRAQIGIGSRVHDIREIARSFREAQTAIAIGNIFENDKTVVDYNKLGIARLIYQLPLTLCRLFLKEVFKDRPYEDFDSETVLTIRKFYENNLNVSETARQLYIHRNTLIYRIDKIEKQTGLDLRKFEDAVILKVAMMVKKYLDSCSNQAQ